METMMKNITKVKFRTELDLRLINALFTSYISEEKCVQKYSKFIASLDEPLFRKYDLGVFLNNLRDDEYTWNRQIGLDKNLNLLDGEFFALYVKSTISVLQSLEYFSEQNQSDFQKVYKSEKCNTDIPDVSILEENVAW